MKHMLNSYHYFLALAEERNISRAAKRLYISHQCLSKYLKNLEEDYNIAFFERAPKLKLTPAGQAFLETIQQIELLENNLENVLDDIRDSKLGLIRFGTTEGRYRILIPELLAKFKVLYPDVKLSVQYTTSNNLSELILKNELDIALINRSYVTHHQLEAQPLLSENMYLVISDPMLAKYFPKRYPDCKREFAKGVDLSEFQEIPFILNERGFNSREALERYLLTRDLRLNCIMELTQQDLHFMMSARDYAASFCFSMYIPTIERMNKENTENKLSHLNFFPILDLDTFNQLVLVTLKGKILPAYGREFNKLIKKVCEDFYIPPYGVVKP